MMLERCASVDRRNWLFKYTLAPEGVQPRLRTPDKGPVIRTFPWNISSHQGQILPRRHHLFLLVAQMTASVPTWSRTFFSRRASTSLHKMKLLSLF